MSNKKKDPALLFYTADFLTGTFTMSNEEVGKYIRLLCLQHQQGELTEKDMFNICNSNDIHILNKFIKNSNGNYYNERLKVESDRRSLYISSRSVNRQGKKKNHINNICKTYVKHMETETETINKDKDKKGGVSPLATVVETLEKMKRFEEFWELYPKRDGKKVGKAEAKKYFVAKIKDEEFLLMMQAVRNYASSKGCRDGYAKDAIRFLRQDFWKDWIEKDKGGDVGGSGSGGGAKIKGQIDYSKYQTA